MSGRDREYSKKSDFLDAVFGRPWIIYGGSLGAVIVCYMLCLIFGDIHTAENPWYWPLMNGAFTFIAVFLVMGLQLINPWCTAKDMDRGELFFLLASLIAYVPWFLYVGLWQLFGEKAYDSVAAITMLVGLWSGLCVIHNLRKEYPD